MLAIIVCNIFGRVSLGLIADKLGRVDVLRWSLVVMIASTVLYPFCRSFIVAVLFIVLPYGAVSPLRNLPLLVVYRSSSVW